MDDLLRSLDQAIATYPFIDRDRQAVIGGSFGGYTVNWLLGHTKRFACAVSHAGLYNLTSFHGASEALWFPAWDMGKTPWTEPELYAKWSPHVHAAGFSTPTLVTHGELVGIRVPLSFTPASSRPPGTACARRRPPARSAPRPPPAQ